MNLSTKQLAVLKSLLSTSSMTATAKDLGISQSQVSRTIQQVEKEFDLDLFSREKGVVKFKPETEKVISKALLLMEHFEDLYREAATLKREINDQHFVVALPSSFTSNIAPKCLKLLWEEYPDARLQLLTGRYSMIESEIESDAADVGFTRIYDKTQFSYTPIDSGTPFCVLPQGHALSDNKEISVGDLKSQPMILIGKGSATRKDIDAWFADGGIEPTIKLEVHSVESACSMVANGFGISIANGTILKGLDQKGIVAIPILGLPRYQYGTIQRKGKIVSEEKQQMIDFFIDTLKEQLHST